MWGSEIPPARALHRRPPPRAPVDTFANQTSPASSSYRAQPGGSACSGACGCGTMGFPCATWCVTTCDAGLLWCWTCTVVLLPPCESTDTWYGAAPGGCMPFFPVSEEPAGALRPHRTKDEKHARRDPEQHREAQPMSRFGQKKMEKRRTRNVRNASVSAAVVLGFCCAQAIARRMADGRVISVTVITEAEYE